MVENIIVLGVGFDFGLGCKLFCKLGTEWNIELGTGLGDKLLGDKIGTIVVEKLGAFARGVTKNNNQYILKIDLE